MQCRVLFLGGVPRHCHLISEDEADRNRNKQHSHILNPVDQRICSAEILLGNDLRYGRPEGGRHERVADTQHCDSHISVSLNTLRRECYHQMGNEDQDGTRYHPSGSLAYLVHQQAE